MKRRWTIILFSGWMALALLSWTLFAFTAGTDWVRGSWLLLGGATALSMATLVTVSLMAGVRSALLFMVCTLVISWLAESIGLQGGWLFGSPYRYNSGIQPVLPGGVPLFIPLAWFSLAGIPAMLLREPTTMHPHGSRNGVRILIKAAWGATGLVACDLALDPISISLGLWTWARPGSYFGVPWGNFAGWWAVAFLIFLAGYGLVGLDRADESRIPLAYVLAWGAAQVALLVLMIPCAFNWVGSAWPVGLSLLAMSPLGINWTQGVYRKIQIRRRLGCDLGFGVDPSESEISRAAPSDATASHSVGKRALTGGGADTYDKKL